MERKQNGTLPYVQGGFPGALLVFTCIEMVFSILFCALTLVSLIASKARMEWTVLVAFIPYIVNVILSVKLFTGLRAMRRGVSGGASSAAGACSGRRIMLWITFGLYNLVLLIGLVQTSGRGFLAALLTDGILLGILLPLIFYYKDAEEILTHAAAEERGQPILTRGVGRFTVLCIIFASILLVTLVLYAVSAINIDSYLNSYSSTVGSYVREYVYFVLLFAIARFLVINMCYRGFLRSHAVQDGSDLRPNGFGIFPTVCVMGSVFYGMLFALRVIDFIQFVRYYSYYSGSSVENYVVPLLIAAGFLVLALAMTRRPARPARTVLTCIGSGLIAFIYVWSVVRTVIRGGSLTFVTVLYQISTVLLIAFYVMALVGAIISRDGKPAPKGMTGAMRGLAIASVALDAAAVIADFIRNDWFSSGNALYNAVWYAIALVALLGLTRMLSVPAETGTDSGTDGTEKQIS